MLLLRREHRQHDMNNPSNMVSARHRTALTHGKGVQTSGEFRISYLCHWRDCLKGVYSMPYELN